MLKSEWKYNIILSGTISQLEGLGKLVNRELLYDLKKITGQVLVTYCDNQLYNNNKNEFHITLLISKVKNPNLRNNNLECFKILLLNVKLFIQSTPQHLY